MCRGRKANLLLGLLVVLLLISVLGGTSQGEASSTTIYVPDDYPTIQEAVNAAGSGDTIIVRDGTYHGSVAVNKSITLKGRKLPVVEAESDSSAFTITADMCMIEGFKVTGNRRFPPGAIEIKSNGNVIKNNIFKLNFVCIYLDNSSINTFENNTFEDYCEGIILKSSSNNILENNTFLGEAKTRGWGQCGIALCHSSNNKIESCSFYDGGITLTVGCYQNEVEDCWVNGKPLVYLEGEAGRTIMSDAGQVILVNCQNIEIKGCRISRATIGIQLLGSSNCKIQNNICRDNTDKSGISLMNSFENLIENNTCEHNYYNIHLGNSSRSILKDNKFNGYGYGVFLDYSSNNIIFNNNFSNNKYGAIQFFESSNYIICLNDFINNDVKAGNYALTCIWNSPKEMIYTCDNGTYISYLGNYWSNYTGNDADGNGVGDIPYSIGPAKDNYPLMKPFENYGVENYEMFNTTSLVKENVTTIIEGTAFLKQNAGISAYTSIEQTIDLSKAESALETVVNKTDKFTAGVVSSTEGVYCWVHKDGWIVVYYPKNELMTQRIESKRNRYLEIGWEVNKRLKDRLIEVCNTLRVVPNDIKYYHFRYPYANKLKAIADYLQIADHKNYGEKIFEITTSDNLALFESSWYHLAGGTYHVKSRFSINKEVISFIESGGAIVERRGRLTYRQLSALSPNKINRVNMTFEPFSGVIIENPLGPSPTQVAFVTIALVYHEEPISTGVTQNAKYISTIDLERPSFLTNLPKPPLPTIITITPSNFTLTPGESITLTATLTDSSGDPLTGKTIYWAIIGDPIISGMLEANYLPSVGITNSTGQGTAIYTPREVPCQTSVKIFASFDGDALYSENRNVSSGKVLPLSPLIIPLLLFGGLLTLTEIGVHLPYSHRVLSRTNFRRTLLTSIICWLSFLLFYPLSFSFSFSSLVLSTKVPVWLLYGLFLIIIVTVFLSMWERSSRWGLVFGIGCWTGAIFGLLLPHPEVEVGDALRATLVEGLTLAGVCISSAFFSSRLVSIRKPQPPPTPAPTPTPRPIITPPISRRNVPISKITTPITLRVPAIQWPTSIDYQESFQNPQHLVLDQEIKRGIIESDLLGLPKVISGRFGCVFRIQCGNKVFAAKCYTLERVDLQERYELISQYLDKLNLPFFVNFIYLQKGVLIKGKPYPILKMEWAEGERLDNFIAYNLYNKELLIRIAEVLIDYIIELQKNNIAHGDIHHDNIMVLVNYKDDSISLYFVDYDGIYIPDFAGEEAPELGHSGYQHPKRNRNHYNEKIDNFSSLIIYLSLLAIAEDPHLWERYYNGECMILTERDLNDPQKSTAIQELLKSHSEKVRKLMKLLLEALNEDPLSDKIQPLNFKKI